MKRVLKLLCLCSFLLATTAKSQILVDTVNLNGDLLLGPALGFSKVEYTDNNDNTFWVKRKTLALGITYKINSDVGLLFQAASNLDTEFEDSRRDDGKGYMLGTGINFRMYKHNKLEFLGYGFLNYISDSYDKPKVEMDVTDIHLGLLMLIRGNHVVSFYGGLDLVPYSEGEITHHNYKVDIERDELLNLKLGLDFTLPGANIKPEITLIGEKTFTITSSFKL